MHRKPADPASAGMNGALNRGRPVVHYPGKKSLHKGPGKQNRHKRTSSRPGVLALILAALLIEAAPASGEGCPVLAGEAIQGGLIWGRVDPAATVTLDDLTLAVLPNGYFVAGFHRDAPPRSVLRVDEGCELVVQVAQRRYRIQRVEGVPQRTVTPPPEQLARIRRERALVAAAKARRIEKPAWLMQIDGAFVWPLRGRISGVYGSQRVYNGTPGNPHYGVDVAAPAGTPVRAPAAGRVTLAEDDLFYSGGTVILDHGYGLSSSFLHLSEVGVAVGDELAAGDRIGAVGASGRATGPHLDWRMSWRDRRIDPQRLVPPLSLEGVAPMNTSSDHQRTPGP